MSFERPYILILLLALPFIWQFLVKKKNIVKIKFTNVDILTKITDDNKKFDLHKTVSLLTILCLFFLIISAAGLRKGIVSKEETKHVVDIILCLDCSTSMLALDFYPKNRFDVAVQAAKEFVKERKNDRIGIVVFSGIPILTCPLTTDTETIIRVLNNSRIGMVKLDGTAIGDAIMLALSRMKQESKSKIIILLTDGRNNMGQIDPITAAKAAQSMGVKIYTIGCGTATGKSLYIVDDPFWGKRQVYLPQDLDEPTLIQIADITNGKYFNVTTKEKMFAVFKEIDKLEKTEIKVKEYKEYTYLYQIFVVLAFICFITRFVIEKILVFRIP
jgi:Ca-activated chloride channel family protein